MSKKYDAGADASLAQAQKTAAMFKKMVMAGHHMHGNPVRVATHKGHKIEIKTSYEVKVDGKKLGIQFGPEQDGSVAYHSVPNQSFPSAVDLVRCLIDVFPGDFGKKSGGKAAPHAGHHTASKAAKKTKKAGN